MARLMAESLDLNQFDGPDPLIVPGVSLEAAQKREGSRLEPLYEASRAATPTSTTDFILHFGVADGYARYRVVKHHPLTLQHIYVGDGWQIPAAHVRGIRLQDVVDDMNRARKFLTPPIAITDYDYSR